MIDYPNQCLQSDMSLPQFLMPVFVCTAWIHAVIEVNRIQPIQSNDLVKLGQNAVQVIDNVARSSSKERPTSLPLPAMVSRRTVVLCSGESV